MPSMSRVVNVEVTSVMKGEDKMKELVANTQTISTMITVNVLHAVQNARHVLFTHSTAIG